MTYRSVKSHLLCALGLVFSIAACASDTEEVVFEEEVLQLPSALTVDTQILSNSCSGAAGSILGGRFSVTLIQNGNDFIWSQASEEGSSTMPLELEGRVCGLDDNRYELRLRGGSTVRVADGDGFCRSTLAVPSTQCNVPVVDLCSDPSAIVMSWDACSQSFYGQFPVALGYSESVCSGIEPCSVEIEMAARLSLSDTTQECEVPVKGRIGCWDGRTCSCATD